MINSNNKHLNSNKINFPVYIFIEKNCSTISDQIQNLNITGVILVLFDQIQVSLEYLLFLSNQLLLFIDHLLSKIDISFTFSVSDFNIAHVIRWWVTDLGGDFAGEFNDVVTSWAGMEELLYSLIVDVEETTALLSFFNFGFKGWIMD